MLITGVFILILCLFLADRKNKVVHKPHRIQYKGQQLSPLQFLASVLINNHVKDSQKPIYSQYNRKGTSRNTNEERCRVIIQRLLHQPFISVRPNFMKNPETGRNLELDMYCEKLHLAFEYNGLQHYVYIPHFHKNGRIDFEKQKRRDKLKKWLCQKNGITLIRIPYHLRREELEPYIKQKLREHGYNVKLK